MTELAEVNNVIKIIDKGIFRKYTIYLHYNKFNLYDHG